GGEGALQGPHGGIVPTFHARADEDRLILGIRQQGPEAGEVTAFAARRAGLIDQSLRAFGTGPERKASSGGALVVVLDIQVECGCDLLRVAQTPRLAGLLACL